jgi:hypothetical protein
MEHCECGTLKEAVRTGVFHQRSGACILVNMAKILDVGDSWVTSG